MTNTISGFDGEYYFLSNFYPSVVMFEGETYPTIEHAFQAAKALDPVKRAEIREAGHPAAAKQMGRRVELRRDWEQVKYGVMLELLRDKFRDPELRVLLLATGDAMLIEGNDWNDKIWGAVWVNGKWIGKNNLGKLLMQVRGVLVGMTRLFFATDLHASERAFRKFVNAAKFYNVSVLILGGDVVGKMVVPILRLGNGRYRATYGDQTHVVETQAALNQLQERLALIGSYFRLMDEDEYLNLVGNRTAIHDLIQTLARERLSRWVEFANERLEGTGIPVFVMGGNDDAPEILQVLYDAQSNVVIPAEERVVRLDDQHSMISLGYSTPTPWHTPREISETTMGEKIDAMMAQVTDPSHCIFNLHDPPVDSSLDVCARVQEGNPPRLVLNGGKPVMHNAGSGAVRRAIVKYQPILSLHGHIHESRGTVRIGRTLCVNPGSEYAEGILRGVIATVEDGKLIGHQLTAG